jgi:hypothetical protein
MDDPPLLGKQMLDARERWEKLDEELQAFGAQVVELTEAQATQFDELWQAERAAWREYEERMMAWLEAGRP